MEFNWTPVAEAKLQFKNKGIVSNSTDIILLSSKSQGTLAGVAERFKTDLQGHHFFAKTGDLRFVVGDQILVSDVEAVAEMPGKYVPVKKQGVKPSEQKQA